MGEVFRNHIIFAVLFADASAAEITHCAVNSTTFTDNIILISMNFLRQGCRSERADSQRGEF